MTLSKAVSLEIESLSKTYRVRRLYENDVDLLYEMMSKNTLFYQYHPPFVTRESILEDMQALPPQKNKEDKYYIGFFKDQTLMANMDLILSYPTEDTAYIGFFMTDVQYQKKGIGSKIIKDTCEYLKMLGYKRVRLGVDKGNPQSIAFWQKNHFAAISEDNYILMELTL